MENIENNEQIVKFSAFLKKELLNQKNISISISIIFMIFILIAPVNKGKWNYLDVVLSTPMVLKGDSPTSEIAQDIYGFRALLFRLDPYANLHTAMPLIGGNWPVDLPTTHPPTAFLLTAPVAFLPMRFAYSMWALLMIGAIIVSLRMYGFSWLSSLSLGLLSLLWPPTITSLGNYPCVWMLGVALAYQQRNRNPLLAGIWIGVASFTKFLPAILLFPFLIKRKWSALAGFALAWGIALAIIFIVSPATIIRYLEVNRYISLYWIGWIGNGSPLIFLFRYFGLPGFGVGIYILIIIFVLNRRIWHNSGNEITSEAWHLFSLYSVVLLPISWAYSIAPLLPGLLILASHNSLKRLFGFLALAGPVIALILKLPSIGVILMLIIPYCLSWIITLDHSLFPFVIRRDHHNSI